MRPNRPEAAQLPHRALDESSAGRLRPSRRTPAPRCACAPVPPGLTLLEARAAIRFALRALGKGEELKAKPFADDSIVELVRVALRDRPGLTLDQLQEVTGRNKFPSILRALGALGAIDDGARLRRDRHFSLQPLLFDDCEENESA